MSLVRKQLSTGTSHITWRRFVDALGRSRGEACNGLSTERVGKTISRGGKRGEKGMRDFFGLRGQCGLSG
jgi:hypothetical protein